jgi:hypothetical protein
MLVWPIRDPLGIRGQICCVLWKKHGVYPGVKHPVSPDEPDVLDAGDGVDGLGVDAWRRVVECVGLFGSL